MVPETRAPKEHFKLLFGSGTSSPAKIRPLKVGPPAINWKSSLYENFHHCGIMNLRVPRITHTELSYDKALLPEARVTGLILNDIRKTRDAGY